jgi:exopolysaccharide biosynthesis polyprenyl glycosylphosphotransferase
MALKYPALGFKIVGFVTSTGSQSKQIEIPHSCNNIPILGEIDGLPELIKAYDVKELLVGLESSEHTLLTDIIRNCEGNEIGIKIMPDMYDIVSGQARISSIYGFPLMEVAPELMKPWEESLKRLMDIVASILILAVGMPLWLLNSIVLKANSKGPLFYRQMRVGKNGRLFKIIKFRSMVADAEKKSGPVWADKNDPRVTSWGRFMRKTHIDEVPQFINVLIGDMSLVGPRPERPEFVESLSQEIPLYKRRLRVRPGITGWAQVKYSYDQSIEDVKNKLKYDLFYIENVSWRLDLIILFHTFYVMLRGKGHT